MNIVFTDTELLQLYELLVKSSADDKLVDKFRKPILALLEKEQDKQTKDAYVSWAAQESKKIDELNLKNTSLVSEKPAKMSIKKK